MIAVQGHNKVNVYVERGKSQYRKEEGRKTEIEREKEREMYLYSLRLSPYK